MLIRKYRSSAFILYCLLYVSINTTLGQDLSLTSIQSKFEAYQQNSLQEKLYVHTDRDTYIAGEPIWFKAYEVDATLHKPLKLSKVLYLEVFNANQEPILQSKFSLKDAYSNGSVIIPGNTATGRYKVRAYTNWMKNYSTDFFFEKDITIINTIDDNKSVASQSIKSAFDAQFFPEGGNLVQDVESKVAFKVTDHFGNGINFKGAVLNERNDTIVKFTPFKFGIGTFNFKPIAGNNYKVYIKPVKGKAFLSTLPSILENGYTMKVFEANPGKLSVTVNTKSKGTETEKVYLFAHTRQLSKSLAVATIANGTAQFNIDKALLGDGISHITIFNQDKIPVCERLVFKKAEQGLTIQAQTEFNHYTSRQPVKVKLTTQDFEGKFETANLSMAVYVTDAIQTEPQENIVSSLLFTSDLTGTVESPGYYLSSHKDVIQATDNLMLTHGWRRFKWDAVLHDQKPVINFLPEHEAMEIKALVTNKKTGEPAAGVLTYFTVPGRDMKFSEASSDEMGYVKFYIKDVFNKQEVVLQAMPHSDKDYNIALADPYMDLAKTNSISEKEIKFPSEFYQTLLLNSIHAQVENYFTNNSSKTQALLNSKYVPFYGKPNNLYVLEDFTKFPKVEDIMREYVKEVIVTRQKQSQTILIMDKYNQVPFTSEPLVLIDGAPIQDMTKLLATDPSIFESLSVIDEKYILGASVFNGIVHFKTHKGDFGGYALDQNASFFDFKGLQAEREFYSPKYASQDKLKSRTPDFRSLLHWQPILQTDAQGQHTVTFYTSDKKGKYVGVIQGITKEGHVGYKTFTFEVGDNL